MRQIPLLILILLLTACAHKQVENMERITHDTLYQSNLRYDSIYIMHERIHVPAITQNQHLHLRPSPTDSVMRSTIPNSRRRLSSFSDRIPNLPNSTIPDTIYDRTTEFRYRLLHDSIYVTRTDTIHDSGPVTLTAWWRNFIKQRSTFIPFLPRGKLLTLFILLTALTLLLRLLRVKL